MLRPSHCNGLIDNTYISILNCHFSPISLQNGWIFTFVLWCQMLASQIGCLKIFITFFPTRPHWMKNPPRQSEPEGNMLRHFIFMFLHQSSAFFKTFTSFVKYFHGWGVEGGSCFQKFQLYSVSAFSGSDRCSILFCEIGIFQKSRCIVLLEFTLMVTRV